jgi:hypothetical protein
MDLRLLFEFRTEIGTMDVGRYIVKARPGVLGGKFEEKRPLRERIEMPVKRHIFINRDSHPDANIYLAIHEAKSLPPQVPDYQVPHCHNTDEFYYFIGDNADLTGLEGQIIFEGRVHRIISPACVYIPTGTVHEYKVTQGAGTVTVLFRNRGYTHEDRPFDAAKGERDFTKYAGYIFHPEVRPTTEIKYHNDAAPGVRYVFIDGRLKPEAGFYQGEFVLAKNFKSVKDLRRVLDIPPRIVYKRFRLHDGGKISLEPQRTPSPSHWAQRRAASSPTDGGASLPRFSAQDR